MEAACQLYEADCFTTLADIAASDVRFHACITDPPYHLTSVVKRFAKTPRNEKTVGKHAYGRHAAGFMGKTWDGGDIAFRPETWRAVYDVLLPGAYLVAFASTRGYHRMVCAIEDAGFVIHPMLAWVFGQGFPKGTNASKQIERATGGPDHTWEGWKYGLQSLKPAMEPICLAQRPMEGTGAQNILKHGCGALNIGASRIPTDATLSRNNAVRSNAQTYKAGTWQAGTFGTGDAEGGRYPANLLHDGSPEVLAAFAAFGEKTSGAWRDDMVQQATTSVAKGSERTRVRHGREPDTGSPARFFTQCQLSPDELRMFYCPKAGKKERRGSRHPAVKPLKLMRWLVNLITPPDGIILDPFAGTGMTGEAALGQGFNITLMEREAEYCRDIRRRIPEVI